MDGGRQKRRQEMPVVASRWEERNDARMRSRRVARLGGSNRPVGSGSDIQCPMDAPVRRFGRSGLGSYALDWLLGRGERIAGRNIVLSGMLCQSRVARVW
jgi:hypothetical protein